MSEHNEYEELKALIHYYYLKLEYDFTEYCVREALADMSAKATQIERLLQSMPSEMNQAALSQIVASLREYDFTMMFQYIAEYVRKTEELIELKVSKLKRL